MATSTEAGLAERLVAVVGSRFGGLSTACHLADAGADVTVPERNEQFGGRASRLKVDGSRFDMGPSWSLLPDVFERFFGHFGKRPEDYYGLEQLDPCYRVFFKDGDRIVVEERFSVSEFTDRYDSVRGTALGMAHTPRQTAITRPPHRSTAVDGLSFTESDTTPGIGVPMCIISGQHAVDVVVEDRSR